MEAFVGVTGERINGEIGNAKSHSEMSRIGTCTRQDLNNPTLRTGVGAPAFGAAHMGAPCLAGCLGCRLQLRRVAVARLASVLGCDLTWAAYAYE
jgi:hypothetical protein